MDTTPSLTEWAQQMADAVQRRARAKEQRHHTGLLNQAQAEQVWVKGMDQVVQTLEGLVGALKHTGQFPHLTVVSYAQSPQGTTTYMRRGTLLSVKGLEPQSPTIEFAIDSGPAFRPDLLVPTIRVISNPQTRQAPGAAREHFCFGISLQGDVVWRLQDAAGGMPLEGGVEDLLRSFLAALLGAD
jgi:hypothetical protein